VNNKADIAGSQPDYNAAEEIVGAAGGRSGYNKLRRRRRSGYNMVDETADAAVSRSD
jgi:hypothetical protein